MASDEEIHKNINERLHATTGLDASRILVGVKEGIATLTGRVDSYAEKVKAVEAAQKVKGVRAVVDELTATLFGQHKHTDEELALAVAQALEWDALVPQEKIIADVKNGVVALTGNVEYNYEKVTAERAIRNLEGVKAIVNRIQVKPTVSPQEVKEKIEEEFLRNALLDASRIEIEVQGSLVRLKGAVRSWIEKEESENIAWSIPGVSAVENRLEVT